MAGHDKLTCVKKIREMTDRVFLKMPLPKINPNTVSGISVLTSLIFVLVLKYSLVLSIILLAATILLDWLDGLIAKKHNLCSEEGCMADIASDRLSEGIIFIPFFMPWFYLFALNNILAYLSFARRRHIILPLRHVFLLYLLFGLFMHA